MAIALESKLKKVRSSDEKGQASIEAVLITVLLLSMSVYGSRYVRDQNFLGKMVSGPWKQLSGMMSTGNWKDAQTALDENLHPHVNTITRIGD